jgi:hypothetical protein
MAELLLHDFLHFPSRNLGIIYNVDRVLYFLLISQYHVCSAIFSLIFTNLRPSEICGHQGPSAFGTGSDSAVIFCVDSVCSLVIVIHVM